MLAFFYSIYYILSEVGRGGFSGNSGEGMLPQNNVTLSARITHWYVFDFNGQAGVREFNNFINFCIIIHHGQALGANFSKI